MTWSELDEHRRYWADPVKVDRYRRALQAVVTDTSVVLDLGCGTGLLGLLALQAGARRVYAVDSGSIIGIARDLAAANGFAGRHIAIRAKSTEIELPEPVDVVVGDQIGGFGFDAGVLEYYEDAAKRLMKSGGVTIPSSLELRIGLIEDTVVDEFVGYWRTSPEGLDLSGISQLAANCDVPRHLKSPQFLGPTVATVTVGATDARPVVFRASLAVDRPGRLHGVAGMFRATMAPGVEMTNDPTLPGTMVHRWQSVYPLSWPVEVAAGDLVQVTFDVRPRAEHVAWTIQATRSGVVLADERHASFLGEILCAEDLADLRQHPHGEGS